MKKTALPTIVFDLDGTLVNTAPDIAHALNTVLVEQGLAAIGPDAAHRLVCSAPGARKLVENAFDMAGRSIDSAQIDAMLARYLDFYLGNIAIDSQLYPGCGDALNVLGARGHRLVVCTNKPEGHAKLLLSALGIADRFAFIAGCDTFPHRKPDGRHLAMAIEAAGGDVANAVMIGDSHIDVVAAKSIAVPIVCVSFGYTQRPIAELSPDRVIDQYCELVDVLDELFCADVAGAPAS